MKSLVKVFLTAFVFVGSFSSTALADECFWRNTVRSFRSETRDSVVIEAGRKDYLVKTFPCFELPFANAIDFRTWPRGSSRVCEGDDLLVVDQFDGRILDTCSIKSIELVEE